MRRILLVVAYAVALFSAVGAVASTAGAVTWHNSGDTAFTATSGPVTFTQTNVPFVCLTSDTSGTLGAGPFSGLTLSITLTSTYTGCTLVGVPGPAECTRTFTATSEPTTGVFAGTLDSTCRQYEFGLLLCVFEGAVHATYLNPSGATAGRFTLPTGPGLRNTGAMTCPWGNNEPIHFVEQTLLVSNATGGPSPHLGPTLKRTP